MVQLQTSFLPSLMARAQKIMNRNRLQAFPPGYCLNTLNITYIFLIVKVINIVRHLTKCRKGLSLFLKVKVTVAQLCPPLCDPVVYTVHGILQARILEWVAFPFSRGSSQPRSPALRVDSSPAEPQGKPIFKSSIILSSTYISVHILCVCLCEHIVFRNSCVCV